MGGGVINEGFYCIPTKIRQRTSSINDPQPKLVLTNESYIIASTTYSQKGGLR